MIRGSFSFISERACIEDSYPKIPNHLIATHVEQRDFAAQKSSVTPLLPVMRLKLFPILGASLYNCTKQG